MINVPHLLLLRSCKLQSLCSQIVDRTLNSLVSIFDDLSHVAIQQFNAKISTKNDKESKKKDSHDQRDSMMERRASYA